MPGPKGDFVKKSIEELIAKSNEPAYITGEFKCFGSDSLIGKALRELTLEKKLVRVGVGIYTPARISSSTGNAIPIYSMMQIAMTAFEKLGFEVDAGSAYRMLNAGESTQVPMKPIINVGKQKIKRRIGFGRQEVVYERDF